ncbi:MAG: serine/threonine-protein kinase, partial [Planctomycetota bacterium]
MMENHIMHCDDRRLKRLLAASDHDVESDPWLQHVDHCPNCQSRLRELAADDHDWQKTVAVLASSDDDTPSLGPNHAAQSGWNEAMVQHLLQPPSHPEMLGRLGRYEIERLIGSGGMGIVFKAFDTELNRPAAVKILAPYLANSRHARKRFAREARAAAGIVDDHVVPIFNVESEGEPPFLVMQYVAGGSLQERLDSGGPLEILEVLRIGLQTAKGLAAAHAQGLIHRDVKPSNILLDEGVERALLTDFGLARAEDEVSLTHTGFHPGTPDYMSPEQVRGETIDSRSDLFGLGCVLYALSTGRPPFHADTSYAVLRRITDQEPSPIQQINPKAPEWFEFIIKRLLAKSPADRFASAREVADLLERCLAHVHQPTDVPLPESLRRRSSPERTFSVRRSILGLLGVASLVAFGLFAAHNRGHEDSGSVANQSATNAPSDNRNFAAGVTDAGNERKGNDAARREFVRLAQQLESSFVVVPAGAAPQTAPGIQTANAPKAA